MSELQTLPWFVRLKTEQAELKKKADDLLGALQDENFKAMVGPKMFAIMQEQWEAMMHYYTLLGTRIDMLEGKER